MFNKIKFKNGFKEGNNTFQNSFKNNKEFKKHLTSFNKNNYVKKNRWNKEMSSINDIRYAEKVYKGKNDFLLKISAADNAVDILMDVDVATGKIKYSIERTMERYINEKDYFEAHTALIDTLAMIKMFAEFCNQEAVEVAKDLIEVIRNKYKFELDFNEKDLTINNGNLKITINDFTKSVEKFSMLDFITFEKTDQSKVNRNDLEESDKIIKKIEYEIKEIWT